MATGWRGEWPPACAHMRRRDTLGCPHDASRRDLLSSCSGLGVQVSSGLLGILLCMVLQKGFCSAWPKGHWGALGTLAGPCSLVVRTTVMESINEGPHGFFGKVGCQARQIDR